MKTLIRARYDGKVLIPDESLDLEEGQNVTVLIVEPSQDVNTLSVEERIAALRRIVERGARGVNLPDEALRRENIYEDRV